MIVPWSTYKTKKLRKVWEPESEILNFNWVFLPFLQFLREKVMENFDKNRLKMTLVGENQLKTKIYTRMSYNNKINSSNILSLSI